MRKTAIALLALGLVVATSAFAANPVRISKIYGGGGNSSAYYRYDFVELYNSSSSAIDLTGWSIQYSSLTGTLQGGTLTTFYTPLSGSIPACGYYLIQEASGANTTAANLPTPDAIGAIAMSGTGAKVSLASSGTQGTPCPTSAWVDFVGWNTTASCYEGAGPAPATANTTYLQRGNDGATDTDNNNTDFTAPICDATTVIHNATGGYTNPGCTPVGAKTTTWGQIKTIYR